MSTRNITNGLLSIKEKDIASRIKQDSITNFYTIDKEIGRGKFAVVKKCHCHATDATFAAKFIKKRRKGKCCRNEILHEIIMLEMALAHPRLVDLKEVYETSHELVLITEYCDGGELFQHCVSEESFKEKDVIRLMRQIIEGIVFLHERNIVHLDLKPQNILLKGKDPTVGNIKLCDLGFARLVNAGEDIRDIIGTPDYVAPEVLSYEPIGTFTDVWSIGVLAYVMLTSHSPFLGETKQETFLNISQVNLDFPEELFCDITKHAVDFIQKCLCKDPRDRLSAQECLDSAWLRQDETYLAPLVNRTPIGSPIGCRRAHPNSPTSTSPELITPKKFKYADCEKCTNADCMCLKTDQIAPVRNGQWEFVLEHNTVPEFGSGKTKTPPANNLDIAEIESDNMSFETDQSKHSMDIKSINVSFSDKSKVIAIETMHSPMNIETNRHVDNAPLNNSLADNKAKLEDEQCINNIGLNGIQQLSEHQLVC